MLKEFKAFLMRGNVVDLAVAVVIGAAFAAVVSAFVDRDHHAAHRHDHLQGLQPDDVRHQREHVQLRHS